MAAGSVRPVRALVLPRVARGDVAAINVVARWAAATRGLGGGRRVAALIGADARARAITSGTVGDPHAARCAVRVGDVGIEVVGASGGVRAFAQQILGGPSELAAPRPLGVVEHALWALVVAAALDDLGVAGQVWACEVPLVIADAVELVVDLEIGGAPFSVGLRAPRSLAMRAPHAGPPAWAAHAHVPAEVVLGRCAIARADLARLAPRTVVIVERASELCVLGGVLGLTVADRDAPAAVVAEVATGYVPRAMSLPDDAHVELTVGLATAQLSLRQVFELAVGQVVPLGRPLAAPFEIRAAGRLVGHGELIDVEGELGVRIVELAAQDRPEE